MFLILCPLANGCIRKAMIDFKKYTLKNGLTVVLHRDNSTPLIAVNILYKVGSRNENPDKTGFAHLFEHLMFSGSRNVKDYDVPIQEAGGDNNAFTNSDITNFYNILPKENLETALWLESDRMLDLNINQRSLDVQKKVVVEEFYETSINQPYGNLWHKLSETAFRVHPYKWPTIGAEVAHIENAQLEDVQAFYSKNYLPNNAILVVTGNFNETEAEEKIEKWFGDIPAGNVEQSDPEEEPLQQGFRQIVLNDKVPADALFMAFHMPGRTHPDFAAYDVLSDILSGGRSSRFYQNLLKNEDIFSSVSAYITGSVDPGLFVIESKLVNRGKIDQARELIWKELTALKNTLIDPVELQKVKNGLISSISFSEVSIIHKAINLAYFEMLGDANLINRQEQEYISITSADLQRVARTILTRENCTEVVYQRTHEDSPGILPN